MRLDGLKAKAPWRTVMFVRGAGFADGGEGAGWGDCLWGMLAEKEKIRVQNIVLSPYTEKGSFERRTVLYPSCQDASIPHMGNGRTRFSTYWL
jgi:hypothetical protein